MWASLLKAAGSFFSKKQVGSMVGSVGRGFGSFLTGPTQQPQDQQEYTQQAQQQITRSASSLMDIVRLLRFSPQLLKLLMLNPAIATAVIAAGAILVILLIMIYAMIELPQIATFPTGTENL